MFRLLIVLCAVFGAMPALAQAPFPNRPIRFIVPFAPGGSNDFTARLMAPRMAASLGQPVVIETRSGAGGMTGVDVAAKAPADGYTVALGTTGAIVIGPSLSRTPPFVAERDLAPITLAINVQVPIVVPAQSPYRNLQELLAAAKAQPGKITFGSSGAGGMPHLAGELLKLRAGFEMQHVPFSGAGPATQAALAGTVQVISAAQGSIMAQLRSGEFRALVQTGAARNIDLPDTPTQEELGIKDANSETFLALFAPAGTPAPVVELLAREVVKVLQRPDVQERYRQAGAPVVGGGPEELRARVAREVPIWREVIRASKIAVE